MSDKPRMMAPMAMPRTPKRTMERLTLTATMTTNKKLDAAALTKSLTQRPNVENQSPLMQTHGGDSRIG
jgi:hypothetical protein